MNKIQPTVSCYPCKQGLSILFIRRSTDGSQGHSGLSLAGQNKHGVLRMPRKVRASLNASRALIWTLLCLTLTTNVPTKDLLGPHSGKRRMRLFLSQGHPSGL